MHKTPEITRLIHDNLWIIVSYAFAQPVVADVVRLQFSGDWKYLKKSMDQYAEMRADRALLEMATQLRVLDDANGLSDTYRKQEHPPMGQVIQADDTRTDLHFRDLTNKAMHGTKYEWRLGGKDPTITVHSGQPERWKYAEINIIALMALVGGLAF
jgi:hypothetical protein